MRFQCFSLLAVLACFGCSSSTSAPVNRSGSEGTPDPSAEQPAEEGSSTEETTPPADKCGAIPKRSGCKNDGSWVRGIAHFDPSHVKAGTKPVLRVVLRHSFTMLKGEEEIGGRLHAWTSVPITDPSRGEVPFALDMCSTGTAMWSEENGAFKLVFILDEDGNNDLDEATSNESARIASTVGPKELAKIVDVDLSCNTPSPCIDVNVDCTGPSCTKIEPMKSCTKKTSSCKSDSSFCK